MIEGLPGAYRCDGIVHCSNLADEMNCADYSTTLHRQQKVFHDQPCMEQRFNPFRFYSPTIDSPLSESYSNPRLHTEYLNSLHCLQLIVFYGISAGLIFLLLAVISLFFFGCCRRNCIRLVILAALISFLFIWLWQKQTVLDFEKTLPSEIMIHERNPTLRNIEFFGLSYWLACGAALATFIGLLLSYCVCCSVGSSRADDKEYEIMQMHNY
jgi:hypothetical protein